ncbi:MAG: hypothetical protein APG12_00238 [Candidatus Methanofastidiosum methylothiophilum]|uniref:Beta-propeller repeat protein n=1 Tax=Candidatus Methanofastidiosum methylothiophilum TaxID=1705564 RepID=A0A150IN89_9EURY|nr:MAG: hypothetical protein APG10_01744 [Candidatus Methanofastidiosum methylthiophilus]KYC46433.1 MAG: hypothetical protein APG11_01882 [Candidatus Methanofastidiosum methylthiophilus]KYC51312.1 MAG: hypothetical protein APG12_00238 [Candidatus Methanofastidiosum methylthiophilus]
MKNNKSLDISLTLILFVALFVILLFSFSILLAEDTTLWEKVYDSGGNDYVVGIARDSSNNLILVGSSWNDTASAGRIVKYDKNGNELWQKGIADRWPGKVSVDSDDNIIVVGEYQINAEFRGFIQKYDKNGNLIFEKTSYNRLRSLDVDEYGNIFVGGVTVFDPLMREICFMEKYDGDGNLVWGRGVNSSATDIKVDLNGDIVLVGSHFNGMTTYDFIEKYDSRGYVIWKKDGVLGGASGLSIDKQNNIITTGNTWTGRHLAKYDSNGTPIWEKRYSDVNGTAVPAVDLFNNIVVSTRHFNGRDWDYLTIMYDEGGDVLWQKTLDSEHNPEFFVNNERPMGVIVDHENNIVVTGNIEIEEFIPDFTQTYFRPIDWLTVKYEGTVPASLESSILASPSSVLKDEIITVTMVVENLGDITAVDVSPVLNAISEDKVTLVTGPSPGSVNIPGGSVSIFQWTFEAISYGNVYFSGNAIGSNSSSNISESNEVVIGEEAPLISNISASPSVVGVGQYVTVKMEIKNNRSVIESNIVPNLNYVGNNILVLASGPTPSSINLNPGETGTIEWMYKAQIPSTLVFMGNAKGMDSESGVSVSNEVIIKDRDIVKPLDNLARGKINKVLDRVTYIENNLPSVLSRDILDKLERVKILIEEAKLSKSPTKTIDLIKEAEELLDEIENELFNEK